jgi:GNAT superfamily N-acetyltransferase
LAAEWRSGANRFDKPGEAFCGVFRAGALVAIGGLNADPYLPDPGTGRLRHVYVRPVWRRRGFGEAVTRHLLSLAQPRFRRVRLRTGDPGAARMNERCGFGRVAEPGATHALALPR